MLVSSWRVSVLGFLDVQSSPPLRIVEQHAWDVWKDPASKRRGLKDIKRPVVTQGSLNYLFLGGGSLLGNFPLYSALFG